MRFLHISQRYAPAVGGSEWHTRKISEGLVARGHEVDVLTTTALDVDSLWRSDHAHVDKTDEIIDGVRVQRVRPRYLPMHGKMMTLLSLVPLLSFKGRFSMPGPLMPSVDSLASMLGYYDAIHATALPFTSLFWAAAMLAKRKNARLIFSPFMHFAVPDRLGYGYGKKYQIEIMRMADRVIAQTSIEKNGLAAMGVDESKISVVGLGLEVEKIPAGDGKRIRDKLGVKGPMALNISARTFDKGATHALDAMCMLWKRGMDTTFVMAGPARDDFLARLAELKPDEKARVIDLGVVDEQTKADLFAAADVFVMPSRSESFGIVYLESWLAGTPVVAARAGAVPDVVRDGTDGALVEFGDVRAIADEVHSLLVNKTKRNTMGEAGRKKVVADYRWSDRFDAYVKILTELLGKDV